MTYKLRKKQLLAAQMIAEGQLDVDIEKHLNIRRNVLDRWRNIAEFRNEIYRHIRNMDNVLPQRIRAMRCSSTSAAQAELSFLPNAKSIQQINKVIEQTSKLTDLELGALKSGDEEMIDIFHKVEQAYVPKLCAELDQVAERMGLPKQCAEVIQDDLTSSEVSQDVLE